MILCVILYFLNLVANLNFLILAFNLYYYIYLILAIKLDSVCQPLLFKHVNLHYLILAVNLY